MPPARTPPRVSGAGAQRRRIDPTTGSVQAGLSAFPAAATNGGMTSQDVLAAYGGLMLKVHYEVGGKQKSFIQYLPPSLLQEQLDEILAEAKGS